MELQKPNFISQILRFLPFWRLFSHCNVKTFLIYQQVADIVTHRNLPLPFPLKKVSETTE